MVDKPEKPGKLDKPQESHAHDEHSGLGHVIQDAWRGAKDGAAAAYRDVVDSPALAGLKEFAIVAGEGALAGGALGAYERQLFAHPEESLAKLENMITPESLKRMPLEDVQKSLIGNEAAIKQLKGWMTGAERKLSECLPKL